MATLTFTLEPTSEDRFSDDPEYAGDFYAAIGRVIVSWGRLERCLDLLVLSAKTIDSPDPVPDEDNLALKRKLRAVRRALRSHPPHQKVQRFITRVLGDMRSIGATRNAIVHGSCGEFSKSGPPKIEFRTTRYSLRGDHWRETLTLTLPQLVALIAKIQKVEAELTLLLLSTGTAPRRRGKPPAPLGPR